MSTAAHFAQSLHTPHHEPSNHSMTRVSPNADLEAKVSELNNQLQTVRRAARHGELELSVLAGRLNGMLEVLPGAVLVIDDDGKIIDCNSRAVEYLHAPLVGCAWSVVVQREFCRGASRNGELRLKSDRWLSLSRNALGNCSGEILLLADVTENRRTAALSQRSERLASLGEMSARLGHQLRTPLASALLYASKLTALGTTEQRQVAENVSHRLRDLSSMVDDMLSFAGGTQLPGEVVSVPELFHEVAETVASQLTPGSQLSIQIADSELQVLVNRGALSGALMNLVTNAAQASIGNSTIELSAVQSCDQVCLTVTDDGPGVSENIRSRLFDPFFTTRPQGTGLGLAVVRSVAESHGGEVMLDCGPHGTAFSICLPVIATANTHSEERESNHV